MPNLKDKHIIGRKKFAIWWRKNHKKLFGKYPIMFSDEKIFSINGGINSQNCRVYSYSREQANEKGGKICSLNFKK